MTFTPWMEENDNNSSDHDTTAAREDDASSNHPDDVPPLPEETVTTTLEHPTGRENHSSNLATTPLFEVALQWLNEGIQNAVVDHLEQQQEEPSCSSSEKLPEATAATYGDDSPLPVLHENAEAVRWRLGDYAQTQVCAVLQNGFFVDEEKQQQCRRIGYRVGQLYLKSASTGRNATTRATTSSLGFIHSTKSSTSTGSTRNGPSGSSSSDPPKEWIDTRNGRRYLEGLHHALLQESRDEESACVIPNHQESMVSLLDSLPSMELVLESLQNFSLCQIVVLTRQQQLLLERQQQHGNQQESEKDDHLPSHHTDDEFYALGQTVGILYRRQQERRRQHDSTAPGGGSEIRQQHEKGCYYDSSEPCCWDDRKGGAQRHDSRETSWYMEGLETAVRESFSQQNSKKVKGRKNQGHNASSCSRAREDEWSLELGHHLDQLPSFDNVWETLQDFAHTEVSSIRRHSNLSEEVKLMRCQQLGRHVGLALSQQLQRFDVQLQNNKLSLQDRALQLGGLLMGVTATASGLALTASAGPALLTITAVVGSSLFSAGLSGSIEAGRRIWSGEKMDGHEYARQVTIGAATGAVVSGISVGAAAAEASLLNTTRATTSATASTARGLWAPLARTSLYAGAAIASDVAYRTTNAIVRGHSLEQVWAALVPHNVLINAMGGAMAGHLVGAATAARASSSRVANTTLDRALRLSETAVAGGVGGGMGASAGVWVHNSMVDPEHQEDYAEHVMRSGIQGATYGLNRGVLHAPKSDNLATAGPGIAASPTMMAVSPSPAALAHSARNAPTAAARTRRGGRSTSASARTHTSSNTNTSVSSSAGILWSHLQHQAGHMLLEWKEEDIRSGVQYLLLMTSKMLGPSSHEATHDKNKSPRPTTTHWRTNKTMEDDPYLAEDDDVDEGKNV